MREIIKMLRRIIGFPFYVAMLLFLLVAHVGQFISFIVGHLGILSMLSYPIHYIFFIPFTITEFIYQKIVGGFD